MACVVAAPSKIRTRALWDLVRARDGVRMDLMRCRHRLSKLLLRHEIRFDDGCAWTERHRAWLATVTLDWPAAQTTLLIIAHGAIDALVHRRDQREIIATLPTSPWTVQVRVNDRSAAPTGAITKTGSGHFHHFMDSRRHLGGPLAREEHRADLGLCP
ncbi:MAG: hypothetical protein ACYC91_19960 [Solirubrobacteraceae bacterium]